MDQLGFNLRSVLIAWLGGEGAHLDETSGNQAAQPQDLVAKLLQLKALEREPADAGFEQRAGGRLRQRAERETMFVSPVQVCDVANMGMA